MKKILLAVTILLCMTCAGCLEGESNLIITDSGEVYMRNKLIGVPLIAEYVESFRKSYENNPNAEISPIAENNMSGYEIRVHYPSIETFAAESNELYTTHDKCKGIQRRKSWFFDAYNFDLMMTGDKKFSPSEAAAIQSMLSQVSFNLVIELPYAADKHNADKFDAENKILTWQLAPVIIGSTADKHMRAQFKIWHREKIAFTIIIGVLLIAATIFFHVKARAEESESIAKDLNFKRNVFAGIFIALIFIAAYLLFATVNFTDADIISVRS